MTRNRRAIERVLEHEGGWADHAADRGRETMWGITRSTLEKWRGRKVTAEEVRALTRDEAIEIYEAEYIKRPKLECIQDDAVFFYCADMSANHGPGNAVKILQRAMGTVAVDGALGPKTLAAVAQCKPDALLLALRRERAVFYGQIIKNDPSQAAFAVGWMRRVFA